LKRILTKSRQSGFSLVELLTALCIFLVISGAAFALLGTSQKRFQSDSQLLNSFQEARLGMDQMVRDINDAGFPPPSYFATVNSTNATHYATTPFAWSPVGASCQIGTTCVSPGEFDLVVETTIDPVNAPYVSWIRYQLVGTTLYRGNYAVAANGDPTTDTNLAQAMAPYVQNVMNNASAAQIANFQSYYPGMFPGGNPVPIFSYICDSSTGPQSCISLGGAPQNVRDISITLIVMSPMPDDQTGRPRLVQLTGRGRRVNPN
jgi:prepilin-type N-terminal cleavage/methylation domain-containing protein